MDNKKIKPLIFKANKISLSELKKKLNPVKVVDNYLNQLEDLFLIRNPKTKFMKEYKKEFDEFLKKFLKNGDIKKSGNWIYFPWNKELIHCLEEKYFFETRTARNIYLLTKEEQMKFYNSTIGIAGLSVGSHIALTLVMIGGSKYLKLADNDEISLSNLNRLRYPVSSIGENKALYVSKNVYEMNPYAKLEIYPEGINEKNIEKFLLKPKIDVLIEEMDNLYLKIKIRELAKKFKIPVLMATDHGDNILIDIERYDLNPDYPILHGLLGNLKSDDIKKLQPNEMVKLVAKIAGAELATTERLFISLFEVGKTIYSWPQLGNAATMCGSVISYLAKKIILGEKLKSGRILVNMDKLFGFVEENINKKVKKFLDDINKL